MEMVNAACSICGKVISGGLFCVDCEGNHTDALLNLLALIHRDGGHNTVQFGIKESVRQAEHIVIEMRSAIE